MNRFDVKRRYGRVPADELAGHFEGGEAGGSFDPQNVADAVFADKLADAEDPRELHVRRDLSYRTVHRSGTNSYANSVDRAHTRLAGRPDWQQFEGHEVFHPLGDETNLLVSPHGLDNGNITSYYHEWVHPRGHHAYGAVLSPDEHADVMRRLGIGGTEPEPEEDQYDPPGTPTGGPNSPGGMYYSRRLKPDAPSPRSTVLTDSTSVVRYGKRCVAAVTGLKSSLEKAKYERRTGVRRMMRVGDPATHDGMIRQINETRDPSGLGPFADFLEEQGAPGAALARQAWENSRDPENVNPPFAMGEWWDGWNPDVERLFIDERGATSTSGPVPVGEMEVAPNVGRHPGRVMLTTVHGPQDERNTGIFQPHDYYLIHHVPVESLEDLHHLTSDLPEPMRNRIVEHLTPHLRSGTSRMSRRGSVRRYAFDERVQFEKAIDANPEDPLTHGVYADWLDENGHHDEAKFRRAMGVWLNRGVHEHLRARPQGNNPAHDDMWLVAEHAEGPGGFQVGERTTGHGAYYYDNLRWPTYRAMEASLRHGYENHVNPSVPTQPVPESNPNVRVGKPDRMSRRVLSFRQPVRRYTTIPHTDPDFLRWVSQAIVSQNSQSGIRETPAKVFADWLQERDDWRAVLFRNMAPMNRLRDKKTGAMGTGNHGVYLPDHTVRSWHPSYHVYFGNEKGYGTAPVVHISSHYWLPTRNPAGPKFRHGWSRLTPDEYHTLRGDASRDGVTFPEAPESHRPTQPPVEPERMSRRDTVRRYSATEGSLPAMLASVTPRMWRGWPHTNQNAPFDLTPRVVAADYLQELGRDREAAILRDTTRHAYIEHDGQVHDAGEISRERHETAGRHGHGAAADLPSDERQYLQTALWSSADDEGNLDDDYNEHSIHPDTMGAMLADYRHFKNTSGYNMGDNTSDGHNFWLSRNGHGTGFFDAEDWSPDQRDELQKRAQQHGDYDLHVGDDGLVHGSYEATPVPDEPHQMSRLLQRRYASVSRREDIHPDQPVHQQPDPVPPNYGDSDRRLWVLNHEPLYRRWQEGEALGDEPAGDDPIEDGFIDRHRDEIDDESHRQPGMGTYPNRMSRRRYAAYYEGGGPEPEPVPEYEEPEEELQPEEGDYLIHTVGNQHRVHQYGHRVLTFPVHEEPGPHLREHADAETFWPNAWMVYGGGSYDHAPYSRRRYAAYRAPAGGMIVRGTGYKGGEMVPDMEGEFANPPQQPVRKEEGAPTPPIGDAPYQVNSGTNAGKVRRIDVMRRIAARRKKVSQIPVNRSRLSGTPSRTVRTGTNTGVKMSRRESVLRYSATGSDADNLLTQLDQHEHHNHRWGLDDPLGGLRGIAADALDEQNRPDEAAVLREANRPILLHEGRVIPARRMFVTEDGYRVHPRDDGRWTDGDMVFNSDDDGHPVDNMGGRLEGDHGLERDPWHPLNS